MYKTRIPICYRENKMEILSPVGGLVNHYLMLLTSTNHMYLFESGWNIYIYLDPAVLWTLYKTAIYGRNSQVCWCCCLSNIKGWSAAPCEGSWVWVGGVQSHFHVKPNSVELSWGCVEVELGLWQYSNLFNLFFFKFSYQLNTWDSYLLS